MRFLFILLVFSMGFGEPQQQDAQRYIIRSAEVKFTSDAPLELIQASNKAISGIIDFDAQSFVIQIDNKAFVGFNSPLQQEHFHENYLESHRYTKSTFKGKIIEKVTLQAGKKISVRAKGLLQIHGIEQERIIKADLEMGENGVLKLESKFSLLLEEHRISIPKIVKEKIAEEIFIQLYAELVVKN